MMDTSLLDNPLLFCPADWPAPANVKALVTKRGSQPCLKKGRYDAFNLALHVDDDPEVVIQNRQFLYQALNLESSPFWLQQIHSNRCIECAHYIRGAESSKIPEADASWTLLKEQACVIMTADCLPILLTNQQGNWVAACHAGWRGLAEGVLENTIESYQGVSTDLMAWIGPAISKNYFEVGSEVREAFISLSLDYQKYFEKNFRGRYQFDMIGLAKLLLKKRGIKSYGGNRCSYAEPMSFYSYRRDGETGRMASLIWFE